ncbi:MAG: hypothetical protein ACYCXE_07575 [Thermoleophilia bacterium]|jgi:hypothetical protein
MKQPKFSKPVWAMVFIVVAVIAALPLLGLAHYTTTNPKFCLTCHGTGETADVSQYSQVHPSYDQVGCVDCHAAGGGHFITDGYRGGYDARPGRVSSNCVRCHGNMTTRSDTSGFKYNVLNINIPHDKHIAAGAKCSDCHRNVAHDLNINPTNRPRMSYCFQCHSSQTSCQTCHPGGPPKENPTTPIPPPARLPQTPSPDVAQATWEVKCSQCHALYPPTLHTGQEWGPIVNQMSGFTGANISAEDKATIISYLNTVAKQP